MASRKRRGRGKKGKDPDPPLPAVALENPTQTDQPELREQTSTSLAKRPASRGGLISGDEADQDQPRKRRAIIRASTPGASFARAPSPSLSQFEPDDPEITQDHRTKALNKWVDLQRKGLAAKPDISQEYTAPPGPLLYVTQHPVHDGRDFRVLHDHTQLVSVERREGSVECWVLDVLDHSRPDAHIVELFKLNPAFHKKNYKTGKVKFKPGNRLLEATICASASEATRLGEIVCQILNRIPGPIHEDDWNNFRAGGFKCRIRSFVEMVALFYWEPSLDQRRLHDDFVAEDGSGKLNLAGAISHVMKSERSTQTVALGGILEIGGPNGYNVGSGIKGLHFVIGEPKKIDSAALNRLAGNLDGFLLGGSYRDSHLRNDPRLSDVVKAHRYVRRELFGMMGTRWQFQDAIEDIRARFYQHHTGPDTGIFSGHSFMLKPLIKGGPGGETVLNPANAIRKALHFSGSTETFKQLQLAIPVPTNNRLLISYVIEQGVSTFVNNQGIINTLQKMFEVASAIELGLIKREDVNIGTCGCTLDESRIVAHVCMHCFAIRRCDTLVWDDRGRHLCQACGQGLKFSTNPLMGTLNDTIRHLATQIIGYERHFLGDLAPTPDIDAILDKLEAQVIGDGLWRDAYNGIENAESAAWTDGAKRSGKSLRSTRHPRHMSIEKPYPMFVDAKNNIHLHHAENIVVTKLVLNLIKGNTIAAFLPWVSKAVAFGQAAGSEYVGRVDYPPTQHDFYDGFDRAADHAHMIRLAFPHKTYRRIEEQDLWTRSTYLDTLAQFKSGVWTGQLPRTAQITVRARLGSIRSIVRQRKGMKASSLNFALWNSTERDSLKQLVDQIEESRKYNPNALKIPRGKDGAPWMWRADHQFLDHDFEFLFCEMYGRLLTWDEICDAKHQTRESPATLLIEFVVQWFENGGKCHLLKCKMTVFHGHPQCYSIGRGMCVIDNNGAFVRDIKAGEMMRTGCNLLFPTDMELHYDRNRRTVIFETWRANAARSNFPINARNIDVLIDAISGVLEETDWYESPKDRSQYYEIPYPRRWRELSKFRVGTDISSEEESIEQFDEELQLLEEEEEPEDSYDVFGEDSVGEESFVEKSSGLDLPQEVRLKLDSPIATVMPGEASLLREGEKRLVPAIPVRPTDVVERTRAFRGRSGLLEAPEVDDGDASIRKTDEASFEGSHQGQSAEQTLIDEPGPATGVTELGPSLPSPSQQYHQSSKQLDLGPEDAVLETQESSEGDNLHEDEGLPVGRVQSEPLVVETFAKLETRRDYSVWYEFSVERDHFMNDTAVSHGRYPNDVLGYPCTDGKYRTGAGATVGRFNDLGEVFDLNGSKIGQKELPEE